MAQDAYDYGEALIEPPGRRLQSEWVGACRANILTGSLPEGSFYGHSVLRADPGTV